MSRRLKRKNRNHKPGPHSESINLYGFIRLVLGNDIADRQIAQRWDIDEKNFHEFKTGHLPIPRLAKLEDLSSILGVNKHMVFQVASGTSARKVFHLIRKNDLAGQTRLLSNQLDEAHSTLVKSEKRYRELFNQANDAIFIADTRTGTLLDCNQQAELLLDRTRDKIIGMNRLNLHPPQKKKFYLKHFRKHVHQGSFIDSYKTEVIKKNGSIVPVSISSRVLELDGKKIIQGIFRDISEASSCSRTGHSGEGESI